MIVEWEGEVLISIGGLMKDMCLCVSVCVFDEAAGSLQAFRRRRAYVFQYVTAHELLQGSWKDGSL